MKYLMLVIFSALYMSSVAYGSADAPACANKVNGNAMSSAGAYTPASDKNDSSSGKR